MSFQYYQTVEDVVQFVRGILSESRDKNVPFITGSIAYSAFVSMLPLILLLAIAASAIGGERMATYVQGATGRYLSPSGQSLLTESIGQAGSQAGLSVIGLVVLLGRVLRVFRALDTAFSAIYDTERKNDILDQFRDGLVVLLTLGFALFAVLTAGLGRRFAPDLPFPGFVGEILLITGLSIVCSPIRHWQARSLQDLVEPHPAQREQRHEKREDDQFERSFSQPSEVQQHPPVAVKISGRHGDPSE